MHKTRKQSCQRQLVLLGIKLYFHICNTDIADKTGLYQVSKRSLIINASPCSDMAWFQYTSSIRRWNSPPPRYLVTDLTDARWSIAAGRPHYWWVQQTGDETPLTIMQTTVKELTHRWT